MVNLFRRVIHQNELRKDEGGYTDDGRVFIGLADKRQIELQVSGANVARPAAVPAASRGASSGGGFSFAGFSGLLRVVLGQLTGSSTTDDLPEGTTNQYHSAQRDYDGLKSGLAAGSNVTLTPNDGPKTLTVAATADMRRADYATNGAPGKVDTAALADSAAGIDDGAGHSAGAAQLAAAVGQSHAQQHALDSTTDHGAASDTVDFNASTAHHGLCPKLPNDASKYLNGTGAWTSPAGGSGNAFLPNLLINGGFDVFQRKTGPVANATYGPDRWYALAEDRPNTGGKTVTISGTGTTRTATASAAIFTADMVGGWLQTPAGWFQISGYTSTTVVSITTASGYTNESTVAFALAFLQSTAGAGPSSSAACGNIVSNHAASQHFGLAQIVESVNTIPLTGQTVTWQGRVKFGATANLRLAVLEWTGAADSVTRDVVKDWTSATYTANNFFLAANLTVTAVAQLAVTANTWTAFNVSGSVSTSAKNLIVLAWPEAATPQNTTLSLAECDLFLSSTTRPWQPRPMGQELALCQRYCQVFGGNQAYEHLAIGIATGTTYCLCTKDLLVSMRATPMQSIIAGADYQMYDGTNTAICTALTGYSASSSTSRIGFVTTVASGLTQYRPYIFRANNTTGARLILEAEL